MKRIRIVLIWVIGISFITIGILKYINLDQASRAVFDRANYPKWFFYVVGTIEFIGGIMLLMTAATSKKLGSILIGIVMLGALSTHFMLKDPYTKFILPGIIFLLAVFMSLDIASRRR